jgi:nucleoid DNA-binding protein
MVKQVEIQTTVNDASVEEFVSKVENDQKRKDCLEIINMMKQVTKEEPKMWGPAIIGFGSYHYRYESGREGEMPKLGFSPRKQSLTLYIGVGDDYDNQLLKKLGKYSTSKVCLYIKKLADVDRNILQELIADSFEKFPRSEQVSGIN